MSSSFAVTPLRSGSSGNLTLAEHDGTAVLIDAGLPSQRGLRQALAEAGLSWDDIDAVLVSHLHADHIHPSAVAACARHDIPILLHERNVRAFSRRVLSRTPAAGPLRTFDGEAFSVGSIRVRPFPVPHDAEGVTTGFLLGSCAAERPVKVAVATDLGHGGDGLFETFVDSDLILIESNYDDGMLDASPRYDRHRVGSDTGHLSNAQAGKLLARALLSSRVMPRAIVLCHISKDHNTPARAVASVSGILAGYGFDGIPVHAARRDAPTRRFEAGVGSAGPRTA